MLTSTNLPRVRGLPIIGNLHQLPTQKLPDRLRTLGR